MKTVHADTYRWVWRPGTDDHLAFDPHEAGLEPFLREALPEGTTFLDVGAHVGRWTVRLSDRAKRVVAVEPNPITLYGLGVNIGLNGLEEKVVAIPAAASDRSGTAEIWDPNGKVAGGSTTTTAAPKDSQTLTVRTMCLDELRLEEVGMVKIDVEGAEAAVLRGMEETLRRCRPALIIEMHHRLYPDLGIEEEVSTLLEKWGYSHRVIFTLNEAVYWEATPI